MAQDRERHTPYPAQLNAFLDEEPTGTFSARTLSEAFENGHRDSRSALRGIESELKKAFADGRLVQFCDGDGETVCDTSSKNGSAKRKLPLYALPGSAGPKNWKIVTFDDTLRGNLPDIHAEETSDGEAASAREPQPSEVDADTGEKGKPNVERSSERIGVDAAINLLKRYPPPDTTAPEWVEEAVLRVWVSRGGVCKHLLHGLDKARGPDKLELIKAGVSRQQRGGWSPDSTVAGNLARLCRTSNVLWANVASSALIECVQSDDGVPVEELPKLAAEPLGYYDNSDHDPDAVLLCAIALDIDVGDLEMIATDCAEVLGARTVVDQKAAEQERVNLLDAEVRELRAHVKHQDKNLRKSEKQEESLRLEIAQLHASAAEAGTAADAERAEMERKLRDRAEAAEAELEDLRGEAERIPELEAQVEGLEGVRDELDDVKSKLKEEQQLRDQIEQDAARNAARVRELTTQVGRAADIRGLPIEDPVALIDALTGPIGQAARYAADRLTHGNANAQDHLILELAADLSRMAGEIPDTDDALSAAEPQAEIASVETPPQGEPEVEPEPEPRPAAETEPAADPDTVPVTASGVDAPASPAFTGRRRRNRIKVQPIGGAGEVGGSAILVSNSSGHNVLLDCGQRVRGEYGLEGAPSFHRRLNQISRLHGILISHAHIDHVGSLPILHREQSANQSEPIPIYMTEPTRDLTRIMLEDSAKIQSSREHDVDRGFLDYGPRSMESAYKISDVNTVLDDEFVRVVGPGLPKRIPGTSFVARYLPVAHILGSCAVHLTDIENDQTLLYTGDLGPISDPQVTLPHYDLQEMLAADLVIMESTYGKPQPEDEETRRLRRGMSGRDRATKLIAQMATGAHERDGSILLPSFSLGRTQELAMLIDRARDDGDAPAGDIYVAGMGEKITSVYDKFSKGENPWARAAAMPRIKEIGTWLLDSDKRFEEIASEILDQGFAYIIASPAMLSGGWSRTFLSQMIGDPRHAIAMTGYIAPHAGNIPGLHRLAKGDVIDLGDDKPRIQADFKRLKGLSAHAPGRDLRDFAKFMARQKESVSFALVHGEETAQKALAEDIAEQNPGATAQALHNSDIWPSPRA